MQLTAWIVLCQEVVRDGRTGEETAGDLVGIRSDCEIVEYASLDEAACFLVASPLEVRFEVPKGVGWSGWREMPPLMQTKFLRLVEAKKQPPSRRAVPVGMAMAKLRHSQESDSGWAIFFVACLSDGDHAAPDLESMADMLAAGDITVCRLSGRRPGGAYDLPEAWRDILVRLIEARRIASAAIERARK